MRRWVLASGNAGKLAELQQGLAPTGVTLIPHDTSDTEETACTFVENALLKARTASRETGLPAIADDSGLVVPALSGQPGIYSARFAGVPQNPAANIQKLLSMMKEMQQTDRSAWFHCALVWIACPEDPAPLICEGQWHGYILPTPRGTRGFGYDPVFCGTGSGKSAAELSPAAKMRLSHRGRAVRHLIQSLKKLNGGK